MGKIKVFFFFGWMVGVNLGYWSVIFNFVFRRYMWLLIMLYIIRIRLVVLCRNYTIFWEVGVS